MYPRKPPPAGVQAALEEGAPLHEIGFEKTNEHDLNQLIIKSYSRTKEISGMYKVLDARVDGIDGKVDLIAKETGQQTGMLGELLRSRIQVETHREVADITIRQVRATTEIEDQADARKKRRALALKVVGALAGALASGGAVALLVQRGCG